MIARRREVRNGYISLYERGNDAPTVRARIPLVSRHVVHFRVVGRTPVQALLLLCKQEVRGSIPLGSTRRKQLQAKTL